MICPQCGATLPDETKYCAFCGSAQPEARPKVDYDTSYLFRSEPSTPKTLSLHVLISAILAVCGAAFGLYLFLSDVDSMSKLVSSPQSNDYLIFSILLLCIAVTFTVLLGVSIVLLLLRRKVGAKLAAMSHLLFGITLLVHRIALLFFYWRNWMGNPLQDHMFLAYIWPIIPAILLIGVGIEEMIRSKKIIETLE